MMQVEDERKQGEQYKDQVRSLNTTMHKHKSVQHVFGHIWGYCAGMVCPNPAYFPPVQPTGRKGEHSHEAAEAAVGRVGGGVSACYSRPQEAAAGAGWSHRGQRCHESWGQLSQEQTQVAKRAKECLSLCLCTFLSSQAGGVSSVSVLFNFNPVNLHFVFFFSLNTSSTVLFSKHLKHKCFYSLVIILTTSKTIVFISIPEATLNPRSNAAGTTAPKSYPITVSY